MFTVWCEWDMGQEGLIFRSEEEAGHWLLNNPNMVEMANERGFGNISFFLNELFFDGLLSISPIEVYTKTEGNV